MGFRWWAHPATALTVWRSRIVVRVGQTNAKNVLGIVGVGRVRPERWGSHLLPEDALRGSRRTITIRDAALVAVHAVEEGAVLGAYWVGSIVAVRVRQLAARRAPAQE